jgi:hypothetical protein
MDLMGSNESGMIQFDKFRSNSECLYCTGQAMDKLLDDPDFMKDFQMDQESSDEDIDADDDDHFLTEGNDN